MELPISTRPLIDTNMVALISGYVKDNRFSRGLRCVAALILRAQFHLLMRGLPVSTQTNELVCYRGVHPALTAH